MNNFGFASEQLSALAKIKAQHFGAYERGTAAMAYAASVSVAGSSIELWGYGGFKNSEVAYLAGISHVINIVKTHSK